jgi:glucose 1-dehydrogenase
MERSLTGQVAFVTGAASGIGRAVALSLAQAGVDVALNDISAKVEAVADEIRALGQQAWAFQLDITDQTAVEKLVAGLPRVDIFVSSAVFSERESFLTADMNGFKKTIDVSLWGAFYALRAVCRRMVEEKVRGSAVIVSSPHGQIAFPNCMAYNIAKAGLDMMMKTAATELLPHRIRVNAVYPGWTDTPGERKFLDDASIQKASAGLPWGRLASPEEIARAVMFLADPASDYITGTILNIEGGLFLPWWSKRGAGDL